MKRLILISAALVLMPALKFNAQEAPVKNADEEKLLALAQEVQAQQALIAQNQAKIEERMAVLAETIRVARIFASRGK